MSDESKPPDPNLLNAAIADRDAAPWRYYQFDREDYKRFLDQQLARIQALTTERDALKAQLAALPPSPAEKEPD